VSVTLSVCLCIHALKRKQLELLTSNFVDTVVWHALTPRSEGEGHMIIKSAAGIGMHIDRTASILKYYK